MRDTLVIILMATILAFAGGLRLGYSYAENYYVNRINTTERALELVISGSGEELSRLSEEIQEGDATDFAILQEIIHVAKTTPVVDPGHCRLELDGMLQIDAISTSR